MTDQPMYYEHHVFCCTNRRPEGHKEGCCASKGAENLRNYMKAKAKELGLSTTRINGAGCLGRCHEGPTVVIYPEGVWYRPESEADIDELLTHHLQQGKIVERLLMTPRAQ